MYKVGDLVLYGSVGVCRITDITEKKSPSGNMGLYYELDPIYRTCTIYSPVSSNKVFMRPVITREEAERLIDIIPTIKAEAYRGGAVRDLVQHYETSMKTYDCADLIELSMSIYAKRRQAIEQKKKFGSIDERFLKRTEELLFGELAVALGISIDEVPGYIEERVSEAKGTS